MAVTVALTEEQDAADAALRRRRLERRGHVVPHLDKALAEDGGR